MRPTPAGLYDLDDSGALIESHIAACLEGSLSSQVALSSSQPHSRSPFQSLITVLRDNGFTPHVSRPFTFSTHKFAVVGCLPNEIQRRWPWLIVATMKECEQQIGSCWLLVPSALAVNAPLPLLYRAARRLRPRAEITEITRRVPFEAARPLGGKSASVLKFNSFFGLRDLISHQRLLQHRTYSWHRRHRSSRARAG